MRQKGLAVFSDVVLVVLLLGGVVWLLLSGGASADWSTDRPLLPLSVEGSRLVLLVTAAAIVLGLALAFVVRRGRDTLVGGEVVRYSAFERLIHWGIALGYLCAFASGAILLRWLSSVSTVETRPLVYQAHYAGAILISLASLTFVAAYRAQGRDALFPRWHDVSPAVARLFAYLGVYGGSGVLGLRLPTSWQKPAQRALAGLGVRPNPREDKFLSVEKVLSFTPLALLTVIVVVTGTVKAAHYFFAISSDVLYWATWLHDLSTILTVLVVGAHFAAIFLVPRNWAGIRAMVTGRMSRHAVAEEFPAWAARLDSEADEPAKTAVAASPSAARR